MKRFLLVCLLVIPNVVVAQDLPKSEFGFSFGYLFEGEGYLAYPNAYGSVGDTYHLRADYVGYFGDNFGMGGFVSYSNPYYFGGNVSALEFGFVVKPRFSASEKVIVKIPIFVGYRTYGNSAGQGLGIDLSAQIQFQTEKVKPFVELGFLSQPVGGSDYSDATYSPCFLLAVGLNF